MTHKSLAWLTIALAAVLDITGGLAFAAAEHISDARGFYFAVATATTAGSDIAPRTTAGHWITVMLMLTTIPLFSATFSLVTAHLTTTQVNLHMKGQEERLKRHVDDRLRHHRSGE